MRLVFYLLLIFHIMSCAETGKDKPVIVVKDVDIPVEYTKIGGIPVPAGYKRTTAGNHSFETWLRALPLKKDKTVYLYNGQKKPNQSAQFAVVDISRSKTDLQQCADVMMRLRAEYLFAERKFDSIRFMDYNKKWYNWTGEDNRPEFDAYLQQVFGWCGSASLEKQLQRIENMADIKAGDVFISGGFPGHAMIVADIAVNNDGDKIFLLVQGYQPAQDVHVVVNPNDLALSPWYRITASNDIITPEWSFNQNQLYRW